jgi:RNA polymerase sigma-70 factor, ECF subfamily
MKLPLAQASITHDRLGRVEQILIKKAASGDLDAFNQLVLCYQNLAYNHAFALLGDGDCAEDVTQESFVKAFQSLNGYRGGSFRGWLLKIVANSAYDLLRHSQRHPSHALFPKDENGQESESHDRLADPAPSVQEIVEQNEFSRELWKLLGELPEIYRSVLILVDIHELDYTEAAQALGIPIGTVKSRLARGRLQMKKKFEQHTLLYLRNCRKVS